MNTTLVWNNLAEVLPKADQLVILAPRDPDEVSTAEIFVYNGQMFYANETGGSIELGELILADFIWAALKHPYSTAID